MLLIDDIARVGLESVYRTTMRILKENDMPRFANLSRAALVAFALTLSAIGAVPPAQAAAPAAIVTVELA